MSLYDIILIPFLFGLIGFFEPCSLGINIIFLNNLSKLSKAKRVLETLIFTFTRGFILALVGLSAAFIGNKFIKIQSSLFTALGVFFIVLGILAIINMYKPIFSVKLDFSRFIKNRSGLRLGIVFGLIIPACAIGFILALVGKTVLMGDLFEGFISLFIFGVTLSIPLIFISYSDKSIKIIQNIHEKTKRLKWLAGVILIIIGILTILSSMWWFNAI